MTAKRGNDWNHDEHVRKLTANGRWNMGYVEKNMEGHKP